MRGMAKPGFPWRRRLSAALLLTAGCVPTQIAPPAPPAPMSVSETVPAYPTAALKPPQPAATDRPMPINLATALRLANAQPLDIVVAQQRVEAANAQLDRTRAYWLPTLFTGVDYFRHDGRSQENKGNIITNDRSSFMA